MPIALRLIAENGSDEDLAWLITNEEACYFLANDKRLYEENPRLFARLVTTFPDEIEKITAGSDHVDVIELLLSTESDESLTESEPSSLSDESEEADNNSAFFNALNQQVQRLQKVTFSPSAKKKVAALKELIDQLLLENRQSCYISIFQQWLEDPNNNAILRHKIQKRKDSKTEAFIEKWSQMLTSHELLEAEEQNASASSSTASSAASSSSGSSDDDCFGDSDWIFLPAKPKRSNRAIEDTAETTASSTCSKTSN